MASVELQGVSKVWPGEVTAVRDVELRIDDGSFVSLVGPSGCGKSTLLSIIAGLEQPSSGVVRFDGQVVNELEPRARDVAMVFQSYALYPHMTVRGNLAFPLEVAGLDRSIIEARVSETAARLGLKELLDRKPRALSGGQRQRVALGRALVRRPRVYLFDEPLSNLDPSLRVQVRAELKKLHEELRATFIYVTHDQAEAMTLSDSVVVLGGGVVQQVGPPREVYARPANTFVAGFLGSPAINLLEPRGPLAALEGGARGLEPAELVIGIRPEHVRIGVGEPPAGAWPARVYLVEPLGSETWVTVELEGLRLTGRASAEWGAGAGEPAWVRVEEGRLLRFEARSGRRVEG